MTAAYKLRDLIDASAFQELLDGLNEAFTFTVTIIDTENCVIASSGEQNFCVRFHRIDDVSAQKCRSFHQELLYQDAEPPATYHYCPHGMVIAATPIVIEGRQMGNVFIGQLFLEEPDPEFYGQQAHSFGFDREEYLAAVRSVPVISKLQLMQRLAFIRAFTNVLCESALARLKSLDSEERFRSVIEKAPEAIVLFDMKSKRPVMANANAELLFGCNRDELYTNGLLCFYPAEQPDGLSPEVSYNDHFARVAMNEDIVFERAIRNKNGEEFLCEVRLVRIPSTKNDLMRASYIDVTERKRFFSELTAAIDIEHKINVGQRQFMGLVSHELRTPLSVIDGAAQLILLKAKSGTDYFKEAHRIRAATGRLADLIDTCLTDERLSSPGLSVEKRTVDIRLLAHKVAKRIQSCTSGHCIEIDLTALPDKFLCDATLLKVMLGNLLDNAVKYWPGGGTIGLRGWSCNGVSVCFEVTDQGVGIVEDQIERIFERFYRVHNDKGIAGAGLGLHLVKQIAELHGGDVRCTSTPGRGSTFTVTLL